MKLIGGAVCHQLPQRTIEVGAELLPVCARCTGIYIGFWIAALYFLIRQRQSGDQLLQGIQIPFAAFSFLPFMIDGGGSYLGLWQSNNLIRIMTGLPAGISLPYFFILLKNIEIHTVGKTPIYKGFGEQLGLMCAGYLVAYFIYFGGFGLYFPIGLMIVAGVLTFMLCAAGILFLWIKKRWQFLFCQCLSVAVWIAGVGWLRFWLGR